MRKIFEIAKWEFVQKVRTKAFIISVILTPIILIGFTLGGTLLSNQDQATTKLIGFVDTSGIYYKAFRLKAEEFKLSNGQPNYLVINLDHTYEKLDDIKKHADNNVLSNKIEGYLLVNNPGTDSVNLEFRSTASANFYDSGRYEKIFNEIKNTYELKKYGLSEIVSKKISREVSIEHVRLDEKGGEKHADFLITFFSSIIFIMMLMTLVISTGGMLVRSLVEEKSNKLIDIIVSSCSSGQLLSGKVIGLSSVGLLQVFIWVIMGAALSRYSVIPIQAFENILLIIIYFILGFLFYTALFVGIGSVVSTEQEAQQITGYLSMLLVFPVILALPAIQNPDIMIIRIFSYIPLTLPAVMMLRLNLAPVPTWDIIITLIVLLFSILFTIILSAKVFRIGILSYGKMPSVKEIISWIREKNW